MPLVRIIIPRFGEGWKKGEIVPMDDEAARVPLENGEVELVNVIKPEPVEAQNEIKCEICGKICKNTAGLKAHMRSHK